MLTLNEIKNNNRHLHERAHNKGLRFAFMYTSADGVEKFIATFMVMSNKEMASTIIADTWGELYVSAVQFIEQFGRVSTVRNSDTSLQPKSQEIE